jgi:hypothetical protein
MGFIISKPFLDYGWALFGDFVFCPCFYYCITPIGASEIGSGMSILGPTIHNTSSRGASTYSTYWAFVACRALMLDFIIIPIGASEIGPGRAVLGPTHPQHSSTGASTLSPLKIEPNGFCLFVY